jgi:cellulose synthase/poly-beta-1,6-N-acetylglucosamine synthase-like glycosyltransferase
LIHSLHILLIALGILVLIPASVLFIECLAALLVTRRNSPIALPARPAGIAVLISAHNEELLIAGTVRSLLRQLTTHDQILVVADNCNDRTAELARAAGATVTERCNPCKRGKGYGLSHGIEFLRVSPPDVVLMFDADCEIDLGVVDCLAGQAVKLNRPVQARYLLECPHLTGGRNAVSSLAFIVKNAVRPSGLDKLGLPCTLTGTGMAFPWTLIESAPLASGHLVEDMELGLHFLRTGHGPKVCSDVTIRGNLPTDSHAAYCQRTRWEHGHMGIICSCALPLMWDGIRRARIEFIATALDLTVPPLALVVGIWAMGAAAATALGLTSGLWTAAALFAIAGAMMGIAITAAWSRHAKHLPLRSLRAIPGYILWKIPLYLKFFIQREKNWVRTARESAVHLVPAAAPPATQPPAIPNEATAA